MAPGEEEHETGPPAAAPLAARATEGLAGARVVIAAAVAFIGLALVARLPWWGAVSGFLIVSVAALWPSSSRSRTADIARRGRRPVAWPDTGMKVVVDALPDPAILTDSRGVVRYANAQAVRRFGRLWPGDPLSFRLRLPALHAALDQVAAGGPPSRVAWAEKSPTERWYVGHVAPARPPGETATDAAGFVLLVIADETDRHIAERMRADFVANASHELRTPLASLTGFIETLLGPARNDEAARERFLRIMLDQAGRMKRLIDDLLSLSRIEMRAHLRPDTVVDLVAIVRGVGDALAPLAKEHRVALELSFEAATMPVVGDRDELTQVFSNLIENAIKYGGSGGRVDVAARAERRTADGPVLAWAARVTDHGPGIAPEHLPRLTERFYRVDVETSRQSKGTGLGLAIVKHILARHRARLHIESEPGKGATFLVRLDAGQPVPAAAEKA